MANLTEEFYKKAHFVPSETCLNYTYNKNTTGLTFDYYPPGWADMSCSYTGESVSCPKIIKLPAYGLEHDEIKIKEIDGAITVKSSSNGDNYCATINKRYKMSNTKFYKSYISKGVLFLEFVDSDNVVYHKVEKVNE